MQSQPKRPFLLPFKGKGASDGWRVKTLRQRLELSQSSCIEIDQEMKKLIDYFGQTFRSALPAYLALHNTGNGKYLRWRKAGSQQSYFTLHENQSGEHFLQSLSMPVRQVILDFEQQRLRLNLLHGLHHYESKTLKRFLSEQKALNGLRRSG